MQYIMLKSKIHCATVTDVEPDYEGSLAIDSNLMEIVKLRPFEKIMVANISNGNRLETYAIPAQAGSGRICLNGAASHKGNKGDKITIFAFGVCTEDEISHHKPLIIRLNKNNLPAGPLKDV